MSLVPQLGTYHLMTTTDDNPDSNGQSRSRSSDADLFAEEMSAEGQEEDRLDELFRALANATRRAIVDELRAIDRPLALADLARDLAETPGEPSGTARGDFDVERLYIELYHHHVPVLTEVDAIEYNEARRTIAKGETFQTVARFLTAALETEEGQ